MVVFTFTLLHSVRLHFTKQKIFTMTFIQSLSKISRGIKQINSCRTIYLTSLRNMASNAQTQFDSLAISLPRPYVYHVQLNRPEKRNAINDQLWLNFRTCFDELSTNPDCRVVVLSGVGKIFCAGLDFESFMKITQEYAAFDDVARKANFLKKKIICYQESLSAIEKCNKPVICAIDGPCVGAGVDMIVAADIRYCTSNSWFQVKEIDLGMAADVGTLQRLPRAVGSSSLARELVFTGRKLESAEAKDCGLVSKVFNSVDILLEEALKTADIIASKSPVAIQTTKQSLIYSQDHTIDEGLQHIANLNQLMLQSDDFASAVVGQVTRSSEPIVFSKL